MHELQLTKSLLDGTCLVIDPDEDVTPADLPSRFSAYVCNSSPLFDRAVMEIFCVSASLTRKCLPDRNSVPHSVLGLALSTM